MERHKSKASSAGANPDINPNSSKLSGQWDCLQHPILISVNRDYQLSGPSPSAQAVDPGLDDYKFVATALCNSLVTFCSLPGLTALSNIAKQASKDLAQVIKPSRAMDRILHCRDDSEAAKIAGEFRDVLFRNVPIIWLDPETDRTSAYARSAVGRWPVAEHAKGMPVCTIFLSDWLAMALGSSGTLHLPSFHKYLLLFQQIICACIGSKFFLYYLIGPENNIAPGIDAKLAPHIRNAERMLHRQLWGGLPVEFMFAWVPEYQPSGWEPYHRYACTLVAPQPGDDPKFKMLRPVDPRSIFRAITQEFFSDFPALPLRTQEPHAKLDKDNKIHAVDPVVNPTPEHMELRFLGKVRPPSQKTGPVGEKAARDGKPGSHVWIKADAIEVRNVAGNPKGVNLVMQKTTVSGDPAPSQAFMNQWEEWYGW